MKHVALTPNLNVNDLPRSIRFYHEVVQLEIHQTVPDKEPFIFAWMKAKDGDVAVFLNDRRAAGENAQPSAAISLYFVIEGLKDCLDRARQYGAIIVKEPFEQFYGMREFICEDPDGFVVIFAERM